MTACIRRAMIERRTPAAAIAWSVSSSNRTSPADDKVGRHVDDGLHVPGLERGIGRGVIGVGHEFDLAVELGGGRGDRGIEPGRRRLHDHAEVRDLVIRNRIEGTRTSR